MAPVSLITAPQERERVAELNLIAGKRAKISTAYASALEYLGAGCALLAEDSWERRYALTFALEFERAECEFLTGNFAAAEERLSIWSERATNLVASAAVTCLRAELYMTLDHFQPVICRRAVERWFLGNHVVRTFDLPPLQGVSLWGVPRVETLG